MRSRALLALCIMELLPSCGGRRRGAQGRTPPAARDAGQRIAVTEAAPPGPSADRTEVDVPLSWIHLLAQPAATGSTPYAIVGARLPCGYSVLYGTSVRNDGRVRIRLRARWDGAVPVPTVVPPCGERPMRSFLVSEGVLRLGDWEVVDATAHSPDDPPLVTRVQHVVPDDAQLAPLAARWTRGCSTDADCTSGGVCAEVETSRVCLPSVDPWLSAHGACPDGTTAAPARNGGEPWQACVAACREGQCPQGLSCSPGAHCLPPHET